MSWIRPKCTSFTFWKYFVCKYQGISQVYIHTYFIHNILKGPIIGYTKWVHNAWVFFDNIVKTNKFITIYLMKELSTRMLKGFNPFFATKNNTLQLISCAKVHISRSKRCIKGGTYLYWYEQGSLTAVSALL